MRRSQLGMFCVRQEVLVGIYVCICLNCSKVIGSFYNTRVIKEKNQILYF